MARRAIRSSLTGILVNGALALVKAVAGVVGNSYALIADAIESSGDVLSSLVVLIGLKISSKPPDESHPQGHGKIEVLAAGFVALALFAAAAMITIQSVHEIRTPHKTPAAWTLLVLLAVIVVKEALFRFVIKVGEEVHSSALKTDAWHHRSDALTSLAAFFGIGIAVLGGEGYESADDWAALFASAVIAVNATLLLRGVIEELVDKNPDSSIERMVRETAMQVDGVLGTHRCFVRKVGLDYLVELDVEVNGELPVRDGHVIAHRVREAIRDRSPSVLRVFVHVEPFANQNRPLKPGDQRYL